MRDYRFFGFTEAGAVALAEALGEDGFVVDVEPPGQVELPGWCVEAFGADVSEGLLEDLAHFYGGFYEGEGMSFG